MTRPVRFLLGQRLHEAQAIAPTTTVLNYLRDHLRRTGSKEGCAEGDCGACTVVLGEADGDVLRYRAVNACILFVPMLDGKQLLTVEDLAEGPTLHPVQRAFVARHAQQCGFCTPGFVMSAFALYHNRPDADRSRIEDALAGNLCRCTGYRPIVEAVQDALAHAPDDAFRAREAETLARLHALAEDAPLHLEGPGGAYHAPRSIDDLAALCQRHEDATLLAGATDIGLWVTKEQRDLPRLIDVSRVAALRVRRVDGAMIEIGAALPYTEAMDAVTGEYPELAPMLRRLGSELIRNAGTFGGNIAGASPIGDSMPALIALGAELLLQRGAEQRSLPLDAFFLAYKKTALAPGEFVRAVRLPRRTAGQHVAAYKISKRPEQDISAALGGFSVTLAPTGRVMAARIAFGGMAATPKRAHTAERVLEGGVWSQALVARAAAALVEDYQPLSDMRASSAYRRAVAGNLLLRFYHASQGSGQAPVTLDDVALAG